MISSPVDFPKVLSESNLEQFQVYKDLGNTPETCVGNDTSGMNLCDSDQVSIVIHIPVSM